MDNFDWQFYIKIYNDLSKINTKEEAYKHYIKYGKKEGRICNKEKYNTFDWKFYLKLYDDLHDINNKNDAFKHYINNGIKEGRICSKETYNNFDWKFYVELYDDLKCVTDENNAFKHYINNGIKEDRVCNKEKYDTFDWEFYTELYDDLKHITNENMALKHYINSGIKENRIYNSNNLYEMFDWEFYITLYNNLKTKEEAYNHWTENSSIALNNDITDIDQYESEKIIEKIVSLDTEESLNNSNLIEPCFITFIIPTIDRVTLYRTIYSLLNLKNKNWKAIIIFDGIKSNFKTNDNRISIIEIEKKGVLSENNTAGLVRNIGFEHVSEKSEWVGFLDDDDCISDDYIDNLKLEIELNNNIDVCIFRMIDSHNTILPPKYNIGINKCNVGISFALRRNIINKVCFKNNKYEDYYFLKELEFKRYKIVISPYISYFIRSEPFNCIELNKSLKRILINF